MILSDILTEEDMRGFLYEKMDLLMKDWLFTNGTLKGLDDCIINFLSELCLDSDCIDMLNESEEN
jgi:hypothetical protein